MYIYLYIPLTFAIKIQVLERLMQRRDRGTCTSHGTRAAACTRHTCKCILGVCVLSLCSALFTCAPTHDDENKLITPPLLLPHTG